MISNYAKLRNIAIMLLLLSHLIRFNYNLTCLLPLGNIRKQLFCPVRTAVGEQIHHTGASAHPGRRERVMKITISPDLKKKINKIKSSFHKTAAKDIKVSMCLTHPY